MPSVSIHRSDPTVPEFFLDLDNQANQLKTSICNQKDKQTYFLENILF